MDGYRTVYQDSLAVLTQWQWGGILILSLKCRISSVFVWGVKQIWSPCLLLYCTTLLLPHSRILLPSAPAGQMVSLQELIQPLNMCGAQTHFHQNTQAWIVLRYTSTSTYTLNILWLRNVQWYKSGVILAFTLTPANTQDTKTHAFH